LNGADRAGSMHKERGGGRVERPDPGPARSNFGLGLDGFHWEVDMGPGGFEPPTDRL
jgi:hypothetical protein